MDWGAHLDTALVCALVGLVSGWFVPRLVAGLPEPAPSGSEQVPAGSDGASSGTGRAADPTAPPSARPDEIGAARSVTHDDDPKPLYSDLAAVPRMSWWTAGWSALVAGLLGASLGWAWPLVYLLPLVPIGVALGWVDLKTRLLPRAIVLPTYLLMLVLLPLSAVFAGDLDALVRAGIGWLAVGFVYWFLWRFTPGMGYGDVRLSGILGMALGFLGYGELLVGSYAGFVIGVVGWVPLRLLRLTKDRNFPFGPFMLLGAVVGVLWGADLAAHLVGGQG
ncbi:prepilin peptidase [Nocardioides sp. JQ2195]|uniref:prepilin peptidase n=1 Tax=Nocardioides sp. JQ2195 TaxID=2592334 RepID=UPI00143ECF89|nr:A24 family peptidase [Nocardioides sp. JQ2195]QIX26893.1 prepilin peptidase [Nocardioides sp. JQ2195]